MKFKIAMAVLVMGLSGGVAFGEDIVTSTAPPTTHVINASTISASAILSPGRYMASIAPNFDSAMGDRLEKAFKRPGIVDVKANSSDSTLHFTIKEGSNIRVADIQKIVASADRSAVISTPVIEGSMKLKPGF